MSVGARRARSFLVGLVALCALAGALLLATVPALAAGAPEPPETTAATRVTDTTAVLNGVLNPHSRSVAGWQFGSGESEPGKNGTCGFLSVVASGPEAEVEAEPVHFEVTGLVPNTSYSFCLVGLTQHGSPTGQVVTFTTLPAVPPTFGEQGSAPGQLWQPLGVGVDAAGNVYVADSENLRVDKFDGSGDFLGAWGRGVNEAEPAEALQMCTTSCQKGSQGSGAGEFSGEGPQGLAVDDELSSMSEGDVYVVDQGNYRVEKFSSSGEFLLMFGGDVNATTGGDVCLAGESCKAGTEGTADGQFEWADHAANIAVGPGGAVYVGDRARVQVFSAAGVWRKNISLAALSGEGKVTALAVDAAGDMFVADQEVAGVHEFAPNGTEGAVVFDPASTNVEALAVNGAGDLFVGDSSGSTYGAFHVLEYSPADEELESFASKTVFPGAGGMVFSESAGAPGEVYVSDPGRDNVWVLPVPGPGPLVESDSEFSTAGQRGVATLEATVNPEGSATTYRFEYVTEAQFKQAGYTGASSTAPVTIGSSFEDQPVSAALTGLAPGDTYHYRVLATNAKGTVTGPDETFEEVPSALVNGPWTSDVSSTSVTLDAEVDPSGTPTEYTVEFGTSPSYGQTLSGSAGEGTGYVQVSRHIQGLLPGTVYHYRLVVRNEVGVVESTDRTFTTDPAGGEELSLPDGRAWELVSPPSKNGALIENFGGDQIQAAQDGSGITYLANEPYGEGIVGKLNVSQVLTTRGADGWSSEDITPPQSLAPADELIKVGHAYVQFSSDLSRALVQERGSQVDLAAPEASEGQSFLRDDLNGSFRALLTPASLTIGALPPATKRKDETDETFAEELAVVVAQTPDLSHVVLQSPLSLIPGAPEGGNAGDNELYEWSGGQLQLVSVLPDGQPAPPRASLAGSEGLQAAVPRAVSSDGRWVAWTLSPKEGPDLFGTEYRDLYGRDMVSGRTVRVGGGQARFQDMSSDGSRILFLEGGELFEFDTTTGVQVDLTTGHGHGTGEHTVGVQEAVSDVSEDGSYVYFVAKGVLAGGAVAGEDNLYVAHEAGGTWTTRLVATLSSDDEHSWYAAAGTAGGVNLGNVRSRVSPDGRYLAFMSDRSLTGYDNRDAVSGQPDQEVYLYDAQAESLVCVSCDATGARPVGVFDTGNNVMMDRGVGRVSALEGQWLAGMLPGWDEAAFGSRSSYQPRFLSDSGRLFFDATDGLVPQDTNGLLDAYEYEPVGIGSCASRALTFSVRLGGCVSLISSGTSSQESAFFDASENGNDVFFLTTSRLTSEDYDDSYDIYDAHVCSAEVPCRVVPVSPPACSSGDSCKAAPSPQPTIFGAPASATFSGVGNLAPVPVAKPSVSRARARKCPRGKSRNGHGRCVKQRARKRSKRAGRVSHERRAK